MVQSHPQFPTPARRLQEWIHELGLGLGYGDLDCIPHVGCSLEVKNAARVGLDWMREVSYSSVCPILLSISTWILGVQRKADNVKKAFFICQPIGVGFKRPWLKIGVPKGNWCTVAIESPIILIQSLSHCHIRRMPPSLPNPTERARLLRSCCQGHEYHHWQLCLGCHGTFSICEGWYRSWDGLTHSLCFQHFTALVLKAIFMIQLF